MRERDLKIAEQCGILERCKAFEAELLNIPDIVLDKFDNGVPFDLSGFLSDIYHVIIVPKYDIRASREDYWTARERLLNSIVELAAKYDLYRTDDRIEDHGEHYYIVFRCGKTWRKDLAGN